MTLLHGTAFQVRGRWRRDDLHYKHANVPNKRACTAAWCTTRFTQRFDLLSNVDFRFLVAVIRANRRLQPVINKEVYLHEKAKILKKAFAPFTNYIFVLVLNFE